MAGVMKVERRSQEDRSRDTKRRLIESTIEHLIQRGFENFSMVEIAKNAGFTRGAIQHHYPSREMLISDVVSEIASRMHPDIAHREFVYMSVSERISNIIDEYWSLIGSPTYFAMIEITVSARHDKALRGVVQGALTEAVRHRDLQWIELFRDTNASANQLHELRLFMLAEMRGLSMRSMMSESARGNARSIEILKRTLLQEIVNAERAGV